MRVLLNGGAGFIGEALADRLRAASADVYVADTMQRIERVRPSLNRANLIPCEFNIPPDDCLKNADVLVQLAWSSQPSNSMSSIADDAKTNIVGSVGLFERSIMAGVKKIIFASSGGTVYGNASILPISEDGHLAPVSAYGVSKLSVERYLQLLSLHHPVTGISLRIGNPYGPYQLRGLPIGLIANFLLQLSKGNPLRIFGDGRIIRDYIWIEDVAEAINRAIFQDMPPGEYNIGSGIGHSINEIADLVESEWGSRTPRTYVDRRSFDVQQVVLAIEKFSSAANWHPTVSLKDGIARMARATKDKSK